MTGMETRDALAVEAQVNVKAIATIVRDLVAGGLSQLHDGCWLRDHRAAATLGQHEYAALEALGVRLSAGGAGAIDGTRSIWW